jgi:hypothetical protein
MKILHLSDLKLVEKNKPNGYIEDIISNCIENIDDEIFVLEDKQYEYLISKYKLQSGVGFELKNMFQKFGIKIEEDSLIDKKFTDMNNLGYEWCELNSKVILLWLEEEAKKRKIPFIRIVGKILLSKAIRNAKGKNL